MVKNYLKIALRSLVKYKIHSLTNVLGFAAALSVVILLFLYVNNEMSADKFHKNYKNIYRLQTIDGVALAPQYADILRESFPEIKKVTRINHQYVQVVLNYKQPVSVDNILFVDKTFFEIFSYETTDGSLEKALENPASLVLTEAEAGRLFGDDEPIGKTVVLNDEHLVTVTAVLKDLSQNASLNFSGILPIDYLGNMRGKDWYDLSNTNFDHYFLCDDRVDVHGLAQKVKIYFNARFPGWHLDNEYDVMPLSEIYFNQTVKDSCRHGNLSQMYILLGIGLLILGVAIINFINLSIAKSAKRSAEIGVRKVVGASRKELILQFLVEAIIICLIGIGVSLVLVELLVPAFNRLFETDLSLNNISRLSSFLFIIAGGILLGVMAGIYPAFYLTAFKPIQVIRGENILGLKTSMFKRGLLVFQFGSAIVLIICTLIITKQRLFMQNQDLGFNPENILFLPDTKISDSLKQELAQHPNIDGLAVSDNLPAYGFNSSGTSWKYKGEEKQIFYLHYEVDANFLHLMEFELKDGRFFSEELDRVRNVCILNETAVKEFGITNPYEAIFYNFSHRDRKEPEAANVIGIVKNFNQKSLHESIQPFIFFYNPNPESGIISLKVKTQNVEVNRQTISYLEEVWNKFSPAIPFSYQFLDNWLDNQYEKELRFQKIFLSFTILAILIACLGLFGLVSFMTEQRTKEIGVRKVLGCTVSGIVVLLSKDFCKWVLISNVIAWPWAYYAMTEWLQNFAYRIDIGWWVFVLAGGLALFIALATVSTLAIKAALANPIEALRYE